jgi:murein L,D-transpeptidase YcbB/YkuD
MSAQRSNIARLVGLGAVMATVTVAACKKSRSAGGDVSRNWTPAKQETYMGVPAAEAQAAITQRLAANAPAGVSADDWKHVKKLYGRFNQQLLWLDDKGVHQPRVEALLNTIAGADSDAIDLTAYPLTELNHALDAIKDKPTAQQLADADVMLSAAFTTYGEDMLTGQVDPKNLAQAWHINPLEEKVDSALALSIREDDFGAALVRMRPQDPGYDSLRMQLGAYREIAAKGGWPTIPDGKQLHRGEKDSPARLAALRGRLAAEGYLAADSSASASGVYDRTLAGAVADFQARHSIGVDSTLGGETLESLNLPADYRVAQIAANLERYRWLPRSLGQRYVLVNVPQFSLRAFDSGQKSLEMKVIVGQEYEDKATPVFSDSMETVVFRPYWNITPDIQAKEIGPKVAADPSYLAANDMEYYKDGGQTRIRQRPGPKNSLGYVKFLFPNDFNIYLHDTPNHELFDKDVRAFSHGCIRVEKPAELAQWVLGWDAGRVDQAMREGKDNQSVRLPKKIPVYIIYATTYVKDGKLYFGNDLYHRDDQLVKAVATGAVGSPAVKPGVEELRKVAGV